MDSLALAYLLIGIGVLLLIPELVDPSGAFLTAAAIAIGIGVVLSFAHGGLMTGMITMAGVFVGVPLLGELLLRWWPHTPMGRRLFRTGPETDATMATMPVNLELEQLRGRLGKTVSVLRPSGVVEFDGQRVDTITEGMLVEPGTWVRCIDVQAGKVIVRPAKPPSEG